ncbi:hypothetical protein GGR52DRAFT_266445 [Hypoxylon sp. FL1284]|nr:hypothetical protein GGR52DRAFT_266445 [Hypoxylon sp. FL1284]
MALSRRVLIVDTRTRTAFSRSWGITGSLGGYGWTSVSLRRLCVVFALNLHNLRRVPGVFNTPFLFASVGILHICAVSFYLLFLLGSFTAMGSCVANTLSFYSFP